VLRSAPTASQCRDDEPTFLQPEAIGEFADAAKRSIYDVIRLRRDVRHFRVGAEVAPDVLRRILEAAHSAPSVGLSQPWGFVLVRDRVVRERIRESLLRARAIEAERYSPARRSAYLAHLGSIPQRVRCGRPARTRGTGARHDVSARDASRERRLCRVG
jgi:nitroreductase